MLLLLHYGAETAILSVYRDIRPCDHARERDMAQPKPECADGRLDLGSVSLQEQNLSGKLIGCRIPDQLLAYGEAGLRIFL
jgi:hypothetical protein